LQPRPNNKLRQIPSEKRKGIVWTTLIHVAVFSFLILVGFSVPPPPELEEGILVNFGTDETGLGMIEPSPPAYQEETSPPPPSNISKRRLRRSKKLIRKLKKNALNRLKLKKSAKLNLKLKGSGRNRLI
jgi:hypothetical protein